MGQSMELRRLLAGSRPVRIAGCNDGLSARIAEGTGFEALWASGLAISAALGLPDAGILTMTEFLAAASTMHKASTLPVIADCDAGFGDANNVMRMIREYGHAGIAAVCIEDKDYPKRNSFREGHTLADPHAFANKITAARMATTDSDVLVIARLESLIVGAGLDDAMLRARMYAKAGADAIVIHSKAKCADEVCSFARSWMDAGEALPVIAIPTAYPQITCSELYEAGISAVIYANQALRAAVSAMRSAFREIAASGSSARLEPTIATVADILDLIGTAEVEDIDRRFGPEVTTATRIAVGKGGV